MELEDFYHVTGIQIRFNDADGFGHVNNTIIQEYFDIGRVHYLKDALGGDKLWKDGRHLLIVSNKTDFYKQTMPDDSIHVYTMVSKIGTKSISMVQWLVRDGETQPTATCESVMAGFNKETQTGMVIPEDWREAFNRMEKGSLSQYLIR